MNQTVYPQPDAPTTLEVIAQNPELLLIDLAVVLVATGVILAYRRYRA